eukprot:2360183-Alexandrium_andersonii.AAC.1
MRGHASRTSGGVTRAKRRVWGDTVCQCARMPPRGPPSTLDADVEERHPVVCLESSLAETDHLDCGMSLAQSSLPALPRRRLR